MRKQSWVEEREEAFFGWLAERVAARQPRWLTHDEKARGWEGLILHHWPTWLMFGWWFYLFTDFSDGYGGTLRWFNLPSPITDPYEWRWWLKHGRWRFVFTEETRWFRIWCRIRGHPSGEIYWNPGGDEPNHHCEDCGEEIG